MAARFENLDLGIEKNISENRLTIAPTCRCGPRLLLPGRDCAPNTRFDEKPRKQQFPALRSRSVLTSRLYLGTEAHTPPQTHIESPVVTMSFRLNFDVSFNFPPPPLRSQRPLPVSDQSQDGSSHETKRGFRGWLQTAQHNYIRVIVCAYSTFSPQSPASY